MMPPAPEPSHASELASAGIEREPPSSPAMSLSATTMIQADPNAIIMTNSTTDATTQDSRVSIVDVDCSINGRPGKVFRYPPKLGRPRLAVQSAGFAQGPCAPLSRNLHARQVAHHLEAQENDSRK